MIWISLGTFHTWHGVVFSEEIPRGFVRVFVERSARRKPAKNPTTNQRGVAKVTDNVFQWRSRSRELESHNSQLPKIVLEHVYQQIQRVRKQFKLLKSTYTSTINIKSFPKSNRHVIFLFLEINRKRKYIHKKSTL